MKNVPMKKIAMLSLSALLLLGAVHAQPVTSAQAAPIIDVPAGNFAKAAVDLLVARGIVMGYPDGTFKGTRPVSRYELAVVLARVLASNLLNTPSAQAALQPGDLDVITKGMQDVAAQIATIDTRLRDALTDIDTLRARLGDTERALEGVIAVAVTRSEFEAALSAARKELAEQMALTEAQTQAALATKADQTQVTELQAQVAELQAKIKAAEELATPAGPTFSVTPENVPNATFEDDAGGRSASNSGGSSLYFGGGIGITPGASTGYTVMMGSEEVLQALGGLGLRVSADLGSTAGFSVQANLTRNFNGGRFSPYAGLGAGVFVSPQIAAVTPKPGTVVDPKAVDPKAANPNTNDIYISVLTGTNYNFTETLRLFAEAETRYALSTKGQATSGTAFGFKLRGGVKLFF